MTILSVDMFGTGPLVAKCTGLAKWGLLGWGESLFSNRRSVLVKTSLGRR